MRRKPVTCHTSQGIAILVGVTYLCFSGPTLLISRGIAAQSLDPSLPVPRLIKALKNPKSLIRLKALEALGDLEPAARTAAVPALLEALKDDNPDVREKALEVLMRLSPSAVPALIEALKDADHIVRGGAIDSLEGLGSAAVPALVEALKDADPSVRMSAALVLGSIGPAASAAVPALLEALKDADVDVRVRAAGALGSIGPAASAAVPALIEALKDADSSVREEAVGSRVAHALEARRDRVTTTISLLKNARDALLMLGGPHGPDRAATVSEVIEFLELLWWRNLQEKLLQWMVAHPYRSAGIAVYPSLLFCWLALHWLRPLWLYRINEGFNQVVTSMSCALLYFPL
jgi:HEAT repeat protein